MKVLATMFRQCILLLPFVFIFFEGKDRSVNPHVLIFFVALMCPRADKSLNINREEGSCKHMLFHELSTSNVIMVIAGCDQESTKVLLS